MVKDGYYYGLGLCAAAILAWHLTGLRGPVAGPLILAAFFLWFFRDPERKTPSGPNLVVSPGDGKVTEAEWIQTEQGSRLRVSIFLSVFDVHVNRSPIGGTVTMVEYRKGDFRNAMEAESVMYNEQTVVTVDNGEYEVSYKQIAGLLARRIVCTVRVGDKVERGQRVGMIKFGSRVDVLMPGEAQLKVKRGMKVKGGSTVLAVVPEQTAAVKSAA